MTTKITAKKFSLSLSLFSPDSLSSGHDELQWNWIIHNCSSTSREELGSRCSTERSQPVCFCHCTSRVPVHLFTCTMDGNMAAAADPKGGVHNYIYTKWWKVFIPPTRWKAPLITGVTHHCFSVGWVNHLLVTTKIFTQLGVFDLGLLGSIEISD